MRLPAAGWIAALVTACSGDPGAPDASTPDASADDGGTSQDAGPAIDPPTPAALPELPRFAPCPSGWRQSGTDDETWCDPWPAGGRPDCATGEVLFPGEAACAPIGTACPAQGEWPEGLPDDAGVLFVRAPAADPVLGGAGTRDAPFETIAEALATAGPGAILALSVGTFREVVPLAAAVTLQGACAGGTVLDPPLPAAGGTVQVTGAGVVVRDLQVRGEGIWVRATGAARLEGLLVADDEFFGIVVDGGEVTGARVVVRDTHGDEFGIGLHVQSGRAELQQMVVERSNSMGLSVIGTGTMAITDLAVLETTPGADGSLGTGIAVGQGGAADLERAVFERSRSAGAFIQNQGSTLRVTDGVFRDGRAQQVDGDGGYGLHVSWSGAIELERVLVEGNQTAGIGLAEGATGVLRDVLIRDNLPRESDGIGGVGIAVTSFSDLDAERLLIVRNLTTGVTVGNEGTTARFSDLTVRDTEAQQSDRDGGFGLAFGEPVAVVLERALFDHNRTAGVYGFQDGTLEATDVTIRDTQTHLSGLLGRGLTVQDSVIVELERGVFEGNREATVFAAGPATTVTLRDVVVDGTLERACVDMPDGCPTTGAGAGIVSILSASMDVSRFSVRHNAICGVQVARNGSIALHDGEVAHNPIGANVQVDDFDFALLQDHVVFHDNGRNLDSSVMSVPDPSFSR